MSDSCNRKNKNKYDGTEKIIEYSGRLPLEFFKWHCLKTQEIKKPPSRDVFVVYHSGNAARMKEVSVEYRVNNEEDYKFEAVHNFQSNFNIDAADLAGILSYRFQTIT